MQSFVAACAQFSVKPMAVAENTEKAIHFVEQAVRENGAKLVVLPESVTTGFTPGCDVTELWDRVSTLPGPVSEPFARAAKALGVHVVLPTYERGPERGTVFNSAALVTPAGDVTATYRKTHLFPTERRAAGGWSTAGDKAVVVETELCTLGLSICYDGDFPELYRAMAVRGAEVVVRPSALLRSFEIWEMVNRARAYDNHVYMLACNAVGGDAGNNFYFGHSMIVSPIARTLALARGGEEVIACLLDPDPIRHVTYGSLAPMVFDHLQDRNLAAYEGLLTPARSRFEPARRIS
jgi:predicted amidohydrolase